MKEVWRLMKEMKMSYDDAFDTFAAERQQRELEYQERQMENYERYPEN